MPPCTTPLIVLTLAVLLSACRQVNPPPPAALPSAPAAGTPLPARVASLTREPIPDTPESPSLTSTPGASSTPDATPVPSLTVTPAATSLPVSLSLDPADWHHWPVIPIVPEFARQVYLVGQSLGNDPHAFSVFGDCQSEPKVFMGQYETNSRAVMLLPLNLQETVAWFSGSFNRPSPTVRGGTSTGALLWTYWHQNRYTCTEYETPLQCELRIHKPSFVIIHVGTHYENRNEGYMRTILDQLIAAGVVPILSSKADDRELDEHVNAQYTRLAVEYNLPFWNFWAAVDGLRNRGLYTRSDAAYQGDLYLTEDAAAIHRLSALQLLDIVRRAVISP